MLTIVTALATLSSVIADIQLWAVLITLAAAAVGTILLWLAYLGTRGSAHRPATAPAAGPAHRRTGDRPSGRRTLVDAKRAGGLRPQPGSYNLEQGQDDLENDRPADAIIAF